MKSKGIEANHKQIICVVDKNVIKSFLDIHSDMPTSAIKRAVKHITNGQSIFFNKYLLIAIKKAVKEGKLTKQVIQNIIDGVK